MARLVKKALKSVLENMKSGEHLNEYEEEAFGRIGKLLSQPEDLVIASYIEGEWNRYASQVILKGGPIAILRKDTGNVHEFDRHVGNPIARHEIRHLEQYSYRRYLDRILDDIDRE